MTFDEKYMKRALQLAACGAERVHPNPKVGAVIVCDGKIVGEGYHRVFGGPHAEVNAIRSVADESLLERSTMYVTLEPCAHYGKTPPCAKLIVEKKIPRVVVGITDPFPKVNGGGIKILRDAGVKVVIDVCRRECYEINRSFFTAHSTKLPYVLIKWAQTADGFIDVCRNPEQKPLAISSSLTAMWSHRLRACYDAIVVGAGTVIADNPSLSVRHWTGRSPLRVVLSGSLTIPSDCQLLTDGQPTIVYNSVKSCKEGAVEYVAIDSANPQAWLADLYGRGVTSVMVEGGAKVLTSIIEAGLWNEARIETNSATVGEGVSAPVLTDFVSQNSENHGNNTICWFRNRVKKP